VEKASGLLCFVLFSQGGNPKNLIWEQKIPLNWLKETQKRPENGNFLALDKHMQHTVSFFRKKSYIFENQNLLNIIRNSRNT